MWVVGKGGSTGYSFAMLEVEWLGDWSGRAKSSRKHRGGCYMVYICHWRQPGDLPWAASSLLSNFLSACIMYSFIWPILGFNFIYFSYWLSPSFLSLLHSQLQCTQSLCKSVILPDISRLTAFSMILVMISLCWTAFPAPSPNFQVVGHNSCATIQSQSHVWRFYFLH